MSQGSLVFVVPIFLTKQCFLMQDVLTLSIIWPGGVTQTKEGWDHYAKANPKWREQLTFSTRQSSLASKMQQVCNVPRCSCGDCRAFSMKLWRLMNPHLSVLYLPNSLV